MTASKKAESKCPVRIEEILASGTSGKTVAKGAAGSQALWRASCERLCIFFFYEQTIKLAFWQIVLSVLTHV